MHLSAYVPAISQANGIDRDLFINGNFFFLLQRRLNMSKKTWKGHYVDIFGKSPGGNLDEKIDAPFRADTNSDYFHYWSICHLFSRLIV